MLSERHAQALAEIEQSLMEEDPALAGCFDTGRTTVHRRWPRHALMVVALVLMVGCAVLGLAAATLACAALAVGGLLVRPRPGRTRPRSAGR